MIISHNKLENLKQPRVMDYEHSKLLKAWQLASVGPHQLMIYPQLINELQLVLTHSTILAEYGCGAGFVMKAIIAHKPALPYRCFIGLEINMKSRLEARKLISLDQAGVIGCDLTNAHFPDNMFDVSICNTILCHFKPQPLRQALFHSVRMLSPGGTMLICVPSMEWPLRKETDYVVLEELGNNAFIAVKHGNSYQLRQCYYSFDIYQAFLRELCIRIVKSKEIIIPDICEIGDRYRRYAGMPLFYLFVIERPLKHEMSVVELNNHSVPHAG
jgi:hypothetical protein